MSDRSRRNKRKDFGSYRRAEKRAQKDILRIPKTVMEVTGKAQMTREGYVFVRVEGMDDDIFVRANKTKGALNGDTVKVAVSAAKSHGPRMEGSVIEIVERSSKPFVGTLHVVGGQAWVLMQSKFMPYDISVDVLDPGGRVLGKRRITDNPAGYDENHKGALRQVKGTNKEFIVNQTFVPEDDEMVEMKAASGLKVAAVIDGWDRGAAEPRGHIVDVLGEPGANDTEMHAILAEYGLPYRFEPEVANAADKISDKITAKDLKGRRDFRDTLTFTIDPEDAKDFDDALSFKKLDNGNYEVGVHIADVSYYVTPDSIVDKEAQARGTSVYLVDRTVPMLPEKLSNKLCSLRPNEDKLTFSAVFEITPDARVAAHWFGRTVIRSDYRFAYETAQQVIDNGQDSLKMELRGGTDGLSAPVADPVLEASPEAAAKLAGRNEAAMGAGVTEGCIIPFELKEAILILNELASILKSRRFEAGAISFERPEMKVEVDAAGRPIRVYQKVSKEANWLIEEFMLLANRSVAEFIATAGKMNGVASKNAKTFVYRIHDLPNTEKLEGVRNMAGTFGYNMDPITDGDSAARSLNALLKAAKGKPEFDALEMLALRSMAKATYSTDNIGHYGLAFRFYTHFTSPIRRYPDTMVHRLLAMYLDGQKSQNKDYYTLQCRHASEREVIAADAERSSVKYKLVEFMQDKIGNEYEGHISGLTTWGMYVEVEPTKIEGMVALRDIKSDFFEFDEDNYRLVGRRSGVVYHLGDPVRIRVRATSMEQRTLDYELVETGLEEHKSHDEEPMAPKGGNKAARKEKVKRAISASKKRSAGKKR